MKWKLERHIRNGLKHRFVGHDRREIYGTSYFVYRCVCGYTEAVPLAGGPHRPLDEDLRPHSDARNLVLHLDLERAYELN